MGECPRWEERRLGARRREEEEEAESGARRLRKETEFLLSNLNCLWWVEGTPGSVLSAVQIMGLLIG